MLKDLGAGDETVLGYMPDQDDGDTRLLGEAEQLRRHFLDLGYRAGGRVQNLRVHCLDRVDYHQLGHHRARLLEDILHKRLAEDEALTGIASETLGAHLDLIDAFLSGDVQGSEISTMQRNLQ